MINPHLSFPALKYPRLDQSFKWRVLIATAHVWFINHFKSLWWRCFCSLATPDVLLLPLVPLCLAVVRCIYGMWPFCLPARNLRHQSKPLCFPAFSSTSPRVLVFLKSRRRLYILVSIFSLSPFSSIFRFYLLFQYLCVLFEGGFICAFWFSVFRLVY